jgi:hypothetical protein
MSSAHHDALVAERDRVLRNLAEFERGELDTGAPAVAAPEIIKLLRGQLARLNQLIAEDGGARES